jgi:hypothetical protein
MFASCSVAISGEDKERGRERGEGRERGRGEEERIYCIRLQVQQSWWNLATDIINKVANNCLVFKFSR